MILVDGSFIVICVRRDAMFHFKEIVCITVYVCFRGGSESHQDGIKIDEDFPVLFENTSVALINDDQVEVSRRE